MREPLHDLLVVLPGIMGSGLADAKGNALWSTGMGTLAGGLITGARRVRAAALPEGIGDDDADDGVRVTGLIDDIHVLPGLWSVEIGYERLRRFLVGRFDTVSTAAATSERPTNYVEHAYDWRVSNRASARQLKSTVEPLLERLRVVEPDAGIVFVAHSMGGLVARYYVDCLGGAELTRKIITLGTPHRGSVNAVDSLVNGAGPRLLGRLRTNLTDFGRSLPSLHQLLPEYACVTDGTAGLRKLDEVAVPGLATAMTADALAFHRELEEAAATSTVTAHPILARTQPTWTTFRVAGEGVELERTLDGDDQRGDGTVPRLSAAPYGVAPDSNIVRYVVDKHGHLTANDAVLAELEGILTARATIPRAPGVQLGVTCPDTLLAGDTLSVEAELFPDRNGEVPDVAVQAALVGAGIPTARAFLLPAGDRLVCTFTNVPAGSYELEVGVPGDAAPVVTPVVALDPGAEKA